jgi:hypothetical protein
MAITTFDGFIASAKQYFSIGKTVTRPAVANSWVTVFDVNGNPGAGVLAGTSTAAGIVPTDATAGFPKINAFGGGSTGYLAQVDYGNTVACRMKIFDLLFKAGAYAFNANTTLAAQPSFSSRVPGGTDFTDTQIWIEAVTAFTGNLSIAVTYTNESGTAGRTTGTVPTGIAPILGRMLQLPLQAGDSGVQKINSVVATGSTAGTFNVLVMRPIWSGRCRMINDGDVHDLAKTAIPIVYEDSALYTVVIPDSTSTGIPEIEFVIANG